MREITLKQFIEEGGTQTAAAAAFECSQSAVSQMLAAGRNIRVTVDADGKIISHYEITSTKRRAI